MDIERVFKAIHAELASLGQPVALAGAFALNAHGISRATADLDLLVGHEAQESVIRSMERLGFETLYRSEGFSNHLHEDPALGRVDFIYVEGPTRDALFAGCELRPFFPGVSVLVPKADHLIAMKVHAMKNDPARRLRDLADIQSLLRLGGADVGSARRLFVKAGLAKDWDELGL